MFVLRREAVRVTLKSAKCNPKYLCRYGSFSEKVPLLDRNSKVETSKIGVIGCGGPASSNSLYLNLRERSFLFNFGEQAFRLAALNGYNLSKVSDVFITTSTWKNVGGLLSLAKQLDHEDYKFNLRLHGPTDVQGILKSSTSFMSYKRHHDVETKLEVNPDNGNALYGKKNEIEMEFVHLVKSDDMKPNSSMAYICKFPAFKGHIDMTKFVEWGITKEQVAKVFQKEEIILGDGRVVQYDDLLINKDPGAVCIVLECFDKGILDALLKNSSFDRYFENGTSNETPYCIVHFTPENILQDKKYKEWMSKFGPDTQHLIINSKNVWNSKPTITMKSLNLLHDTIYPLPVSVGNYAPSTPTPDEDFQKENLLVYRTENDDRVGMAPRKPIHRLESSPEMEPDQEERYFKRIEEYVIPFKSVIKEATQALSSLQEYPKITMLGTGSTMSTKYRNTTGILLQVSRVTSIILDCSEGTFAQMFKLFGRDECYRILSTIKAIYVSHTHADHHLGLITLLKERATVNSKPVYFFAPFSLLKWIEYCNIAIEEIGQYTRFFGNHLFNQKSEKRIEKRKIEVLLRDLELKDLRTTFVFHYKDSFGILLTLADDRKIVYSGDARPSRNLVDLGMNCDFLIHEATHEDELKNLAKLKRHSTTSEAINMGVQMKAKYTLLTHFSQRYYILPKVSQIGSNANVGIAFDFMQIPLSHLPLLPLFNQILPAVFKEPTYELDMRARVRELRKNKKRSLAV